MRPISRTFLVAGLLFVLFSSNESPETVKADQTRQRENSVLCNGRVRDAAVGLLSFAGYRRVALGLPWEGITTLGFKIRNNKSMPLILGLPAPSTRLPSSASLAAQTIDVSVNDNFFTPQTIHISVGDTVRWTWQGAPHSVTSGRCFSDDYEDCTIDNKFCSPSDTNCVAGFPSQIGFIYTHQFTQTGVYTYFCNQHFALMTGSVIVEAAVAPTIQFSTSNYSVGEGAGAASVTISRGGATGSAASVDYASNDAAGLTNCDVINGVASPRCDYAISVGRINFAAGETSKNISIPIVDDSYAEGSENFTITLSNATGATLSSPSTATVTINDNESSNGPNPIDGTAFFVRQQYIDFLGREPDPGGFQDWQNIINNCAAGDTNCDRIHVSRAFFQSPEFQVRGYFLYRFYPTAFGRKPDYNEFIPDLAGVSGFLDDAQLEAARVAFINNFMARPGFTSVYNPLTNAQYVDTLLNTAGITHPARDFWVAALGDGSRTRAQVLREIAESGAVYDKYYNQAFVVMQYFGYLRRQPDAFYLDWIAILNANPNDSRAMVSGFMNSSEYRVRFGP